MSGWGLLTMSTAVWSAHRCSWPRLANAPVSGITMPTGTSLTAAAPPAAGMGAWAERAGASAVRSRATLTPGFSHRMDATPPRGAVWRRRGISCPAASDAEVGLPDEVGGKQLRARALRDHPAGLQDVAASAGLEGRVDVLLDQEDGQAL